MLTDSEMRESARIQPKRWQKITNMSSLLSKATKTFSSVIDEAKEEEKKRVKYPRISVNTLLPNAFKPQEVNISPV